jgi:maltose alpha-D-glucosyltransferase/alpha-amylase
LFASQYRAHLEREAPELIAPDDLLRAFLMEKALYELEYEVNNRPDWVAIPLAGLRSLAS